MRLVLAAVLAVAALIPSGESQGWLPGSTLAEPTLYLVLNGPDTWSVDLAAHGWGDRVRVVSSCPPAGNCLRVVERRFGKTVWFGRYDPTNRRIDLNNTIESTPVQRLVAACHEIGHALGVGHAPEWVATCMQPAVSVFATPGIWGIGHIGTTKY